MIVSQLVKEFRKFEEPVYYRGAKSGSHGGEYEDNCQGDHRPDDGSSKHL
jgi:hypothetical protein